MPQDKPRRGIHPVYLCLLIPYAAFAWVPFYNRIAPQLLGIPFFYWWQMVWIILTAVSIVPVYLFEEKRGI
ncbi:MAG TPA: DUF3311 domain-containing protein [Rhizomicrobium sp.]|nr:DUF3311 domain-containing protein [Rhizomicrobium sp.]